MNTAVRNIVLVGFMSTGKTTIGAALAQRLGWTFVDTDQLIMEQLGLSIPDIFAKFGESYFRDAEAKALRKVMQGERQVVSTGGGCVLRKENREAMTAGGLVVALTAPADVLISRLRGDADRPLLQGGVEERVHRLLKEREHAYDFAHATIDTSIHSIQEAAEQIIAIAKETVN